MALLRLPRLQEPRALTNRCNTKWTQPPSDGLRDIERRSRRAQPACSALPLPWVDQRHFATLLRLMTQIVSPRLNQVSHANVWSRVVGLILSFTDSCYSDTGSKQHGRVLDTPTGLRASMVFGEVGEAHCLSEK